MANGSSSNRKEKIKKWNIVEWGRKNNGKRFMDMYDKLPYEFYKSYLMIKTKIIIQSDTQVNDI